MKKFIFFPCLLFAGMAFSQTNDALVSFVNPSALSAPNGYSHAVVINLGNCNMIMLSGQVPLDKQGTLVGKDDFEKQAEQVFTNIKSAINELGGSMDNIVKFSYFITDIAQLQKLRTIRNKYINTKNPPASTLVQVSKLFRDDVMLEVEATVIIPKKQ